MKSKVLAILFALLLVSVSSFAGNITVISGDLSVVSNRSITAKVVFDYTDLILEGKPYMEHLQSKGHDFVRDWPMESVASETYFIKCWNKDNKDGMQISSTENNGYMMYFHVKKMHMGSGAASMLVGFGAGGASMSGVMYIFKDMNPIPVLTVEINDQTGRSGMTELVRRTDLYGELAEDLVKSIMKTNKSKVRPSTTPVQVPAFNMASSGAAVQTAAPATTITATAASVPAQQAVAQEVPVQQTVYPAEAPAANTTVQAVQVPQNSQTFETFEQAKGVPATLINAESHLELGRKGDAGNVDELESEKRISLYIDYRDAIFDNKGLEDFIEYMESAADDRDRDPNFRNNWESKHKNTLALAFIEEANGKLSNKDLYVTLTTKQGCKYSVKVVVAKFDDDGNNVCDCLVVRTETGDVIAHYRLEAKGGKFGEYIGLLEQGLASAGEAFGEWLADELD